MGETAGSRPPTMTRRPVAVLVLLATLLLAAAGLVACGGKNHGGGSGDPKSGTKGSHSGDTTKTGTNGGTGGNKSIGKFTLDFAKCMRANGVPNFPDPNGKGGQLGPDSGIDVGGSAFQSALNGPCKSLAPQEWVSDGPGSQPTGPSQ